MYSTQYCVPVSFRHKDIPSSHPYRRGVAERPVCAPGVEASVVAVGVGSLEDLTDVVELSRGLVTNYPSESPEAARDRRSVGASGLALAHAAAATTTAAEAHLEVRVGVILLGPGGHAIFAVVNAVVERARGGGEGRERGEEGGGGRRDFHVSFNPSSDLPHSHKTP